MDLFSLIIILVIVGVVLWAINSFIPMQAQVKSILNVAVVIVLVIWLLSLFVGYVPNPTIGHK
jgi:hypothetical protein